MVRKSQYRALGWQDSQSPLAERFCASTHATPKRCECLLQLLSVGRRQRQIIWACLERLLGQVDHHGHRGLRS